MAKAKQNIKVETKKRQRPASTPEARENQMIALAVDLAEQQLREGTASSQVITHFLKLGSTKNELEKEKIRKETELLNAKAMSFESAKKIEELYINALNAMKSYRGDES